MDNSIKNDARLAVGRPWDFAHHSKSSKTESGKVMLIRLLTNSSLLALR